MIVSLAMAQFVPSSNENITEESVHVYVCLCMCVHV